MLQEHFYRLNYFRKKVLMWGTTFFLRFKDKWIMQIRDNKGNSLAKVKRPENTPHVNNAPDIIQRAKLFKKLMNFKNWESNKLKGVCFMRIWHLQTNHLEKWSSYCFWNGLPDQAVCVCVRMHACVLTCTFVLVTQSHPTLCNPMNVAWQAPLSIGFPRQYCSG